MVYNITIGDNWHGRVVINVRGRSMYESHVTCHVTSPCSVGSYVFYVRRGEDANLPIQFALPPIFIVLLDDVYSISGTYCEFIVLLSGVAVEH